MKNYLATKENIYRYQGNDDFLIINKDLRIINDKPNIIYFNKDIRVENNIITFKNNIFDLSSIKHNLIGKHNLGNIAIAYAIYQSYLSLINALVKLFKVLKP